MSHRYHPDESMEDDPEALYFDDCRDCTHHAAETPYTLDTTKAQALWNRMIDVEVNDTDHYRSENEAIACKELWKTYIFLQRFTALDPKGLYSWTRE
jgi:hypothetical protein